MREENHGDGVGRWEGLLRMVITASKRTLDRDCRKSTWNGVVWRPALSRMAHLKAFICAWPPEQT